jgi:hypothetical protein
MPFVSCMPSATMSSCVEPFKAASTCLTKTVFLDDESQQNLSIHRVLKQLGITSSTQGSPSTSGRFEAAVSPGFPMNGQDSLQAERPSTPCLDDQHKHSCVGSTAASSVSSPSNLLGVPSSSSTPNGAVHSSTEDEPLLRENEDRFTMFPIQ